MRLRAVVAGRAGAAEAHAQAARRQRVPVRGLEAVEACGAVRKPVSPAPVRASLHLQLHELQLTLLRLLHAFLLARQLDCQREGLVKRHLLLLDALLQQPPPPAQLLQALLVLLQQG